MSKPTDAALRAAKELDLDVLRADDLPEAEVEAALCIDRVTGLPELVESLAGWIVIAQMNGAHTGEFGEWASGVLKGSKRTPAEVTRAAIEAVEGTKL